MAKKRHFLTLSSLMAIAILAVVSIGPATGQTNQLPIAEVTANPTTGAAGQWILFDGTASVDPDGTIATVTWDFGDGVTLKDKTMDEAGLVYHTFTDGTYTVTLTVTDDGGAVNDPADPKSTIVITIGTGTPPTTTTTAPPTTTTTAPTSGPDGAALFTTTCSVCHTQADLAGRGLSNAQIVDVMTTGLMTAQASGLSTAEIQAVADYIIPAAGGTTTTTTPSGTTTTTAAPAGASASSLFTTTCSACHTKANITDRGLSSAQLVTVMTSGIMKAQASSLSSSQIQAVAGYLAASGSSTGETTTTTAAPAGASASSLFATTCSACHTKANITDRGLSSSQIAAALTSGIMKAQASSLSSSQIQAVAGYLAASGSSTGETTTTTAAPAGTDGASLFAATCSACHTQSNISDRGLSSQELVTVMTSGIMTAQASSLSSDQIQAVAAYLTSAGSSDTTTDTGATDTGDTGTVETYTASPEAAGLYDANCAACHGSSGEGGVGPSLVDTAYNFDATVAVISNGVGSMPGFSSGLTEDQIKDIAAYSVGFQPGTTAALPSGEGADVYAASCAACHGAKGEGASAMPINVPFDNDQLMEIIRVGIGDMPGFATTLSDTQITSLAEYVHALAAMAAPPVTEAPPSEDYIVAIQPSKYVEFDTERSSVPLEPTARLAFALGTLAVLAGLAFWEIQRSKKGPQVAGSDGTSPSGSA